MRKKDRLSDRSRFNSTIVRLKAGNVSADTSSLRVFQFYDSTIKSINLCVSKDKELVGFNSTIVRLKDA